MDYATLKAGLDIFKDNSVNFDEAICIDLKTGESLMAKDGKWIQKAIKKPGALHKELGVKEGEKIPAKKMAAAANGKMGPLAQKRATLAKTLKGFKK